MNGPYRKRSYSNAFGSYNGAASSMRMRNMPAPTWGRSLAGGYAQRRGARYNRYGGQSNQVSRIISRVLNTTTRPVYPVPESKYSDAVVSALSVTNTGILTLINGIAPGTGSQGRIGLQVATKNVYYQYTLTNGATPIPTVTRMMLIWDRQPNGSATPATVPDVLQTAIGPVPAYLAANNLVNKHRFVVLSDERISLSPNGEQIEYDTGFRQINQLSEYPEAANNPQTGALLLLLASNTSVAASQPVFNGNYRIRFKDC